jgi:hypothetical protein
MAVPTSGTLNLSTVNSVFGWGGAMSGYAGRTYYYLSQFGSTAIGQFPTSNFSMSRFYGTSGHDEWNCACNCNCVCGK